MAEKGNRGLAALGIGSAVLVLGALGALGEQPRMEDSIETLSTYYASGRARLLLCTYVAALGLMVTLLFLGALADRLERDARDARGLLRVGLAAGALWIGAILLGMAGPILVAYRGTSWNPEAARALVELFPIIAGLSCFPTALQMWSYARVQAEVGDRWPAWIGYAVAVAHLVAAGCFASAGAFAPTGVFAGLLVPTCYYIWIVATCIAQVRAPARAESALPISAERSRSA